MSEDDYVRIYIPNASSIMVLLHCIAIVVGSIFGIFYLIFAEPKVANFIFAGYLLVASLLIYGGVWLCKWLVDLVHRKLKVKDLTKYRDDYIIGFGAIGACAIAFRLVVYFVEFELLAILFAGALYLITTSIIFCVFIGENFWRICTWRDSNSHSTEKFYIISALSHIVLLIISIRFAIEYPHPRSDRIIICQLIGTVGSTLAIGDFARLLTVGVRLLNGRTTEVATVTKAPTVQEDTNEEPEPTVENEAEVAPKPTCNICLIPYTDSGVHTPRIIKECGHTVCEQCIDSLLKPNNGRFLDCPFCQKMTVVNGPAKNLSKNYGMLEMMAEVQDPSQIA